MGRIACVVWCLAITACYTPPEPDCGFVCGAHGECPADYSCATDFRCHRVGTPTTLECVPMPVFAVSAAASTSTRVDVAFTAPPSPSEAMTLANYAIPGLTLSGTPSLVGDTVLITTSPQTGDTYTLTVSGVTRASDGVSLALATASFAGYPAFDVAAAAATSAHQIAVTFDAPPDPTQATTLANYAVAGLTLSGTPTLTNNTVFITTSVQAATAYTASVLGVTRASDGEPLAVSTATFTGRAPFDVASAASTSSHQITVTFDAAPDPTLATTLGNYAASGLTLSGTPSLAGTTVTIATSAQTATSYTVTVSNVTRAADAEPLTTAAAMFTGRAPFDVASAASTSNIAMTVTFDAAPNASQAAMLANYSVTGLTLSGTPSVVGSTVRISTSFQIATSYTVTVAGVARASDGEPLTTATAMFTGTAPSCSDLIKNGNETDVDCGGATCVARCALTKMCLVNTDCVSNNCNAVTLVCQ